MLAAALIVGGIGASTQHPLASTLVARAFTGARAIKALGTYNFAGDIGKMIMPAAAALLITQMPWRPAVALLGACGFAAALVVLALMPRQAGESAAAGQSTADAAVGAPRRGFPLLVSIGVIDSATRMPFLTFLPFLLAAKGASVSAIGLALTLVFAGGACGKLVCAFLGARIGVFATVVLTESLTALGIVALLPLGLAACFALLASYRRRPQWHVVGALRLGPDAGGSGAARARLQHLLYRHHRGGRDRADPLRLHRRSHRGEGDARRARRGRARHPAARASRCGRRSPRRARRRADGARQHTRPS